MKAKLFVAVLASMIATTGLAQTNGAPKAKAKAPTKKSAAAGSETTPDNSSEQAKEVPPQEATDPSAASSSVAAVPTVTATVKPRPYKLGLYIRPQVSGEGIVKGDPAVSQFNYVSASYMLSDTKTVGVRQEFTNKYAKGDKKAEAHMSDTFVTYIDSGLGALPGGFKTTAVTRFYLPTGETSRFKTKQNGAFLGLLAADKSIGKFDFTAGLLGLYILNSQDSYIDGGKVNATEDFEIDPNVNVGYNLTSAVSVYQYVEYDHYFMRGSVGPRMTTAYLGETGVSYKATKQLSFSASVLNVIDTYAPTRTFTLFRPEESTYRVALSASL